MPAAAVDDPPPPGPGGAPEKAALSPAERAEARLALRSIAEGRLPRNPPAPAPAGVRWADIPLALHLAGDERGVELVVVETCEEEDEGRYRFTLRTVEDWPGELIIERREAPAIYEVVACRLGRFPQRPARQERCRLLLEKLRRHLEALGAQPWFNEHPP